MKLTKYEPLATLQLGYLAVKKTTLQIDNIASLYNPLYRIVQRIVNFLKFPKCNQLGQAVSPSSGGLFELSDMFFVSESRDLMIGRHPIRRELLDATETNRNVPTRFIISRLSILMIFLYIARTWIFKGGGQLVYT